MMVVKVISVLVVSLLGICASVDHSHPQSNHAISSQSFVRHDVPLSYQYSAVHVYSTPKPDRYQQKPLPLKHHHGKSQLPKEIQYAPIFSEQSFQNNLYQKYANRNVDNLVPGNLNSISITKPHLEPRPDQLKPVEHQQEHLSYVPGYNVELLQAMNRYPGNNAVYRSYPNMSPNDKISKVNVLSQYVLYQKPENEFKSSTLVASPLVPHQLEQTKATLSPFVLKQFAPTEHKSNGYKHPHTILDPTPSVQALLSLQEGVLHPKAHKLLLNIARTYNIAENAQKAPHASLTMLKNLPAHTQAIIHLPGPANVDRNTRLLPMQKKQLGQLAHRLS